MEDQARALVAKLRRQLIEMNADMETLATEHNVETEATMNTRSIFGQHRVCVRSLALDFRQAL